MNKFQPLKKVKDPFMADDKEDKVDIIWRVHKMAEAVEEECLKTDEIHPLEWVVEWLLELENKLFERGKEKDAKEFIHNPRTPNYPAYSKVIEAEQDIHREGFHLIGCPKCGYVEEADTKEDIQEKGKERLIMGNEKLSVEASSLDVEKDVLLSNISSSPLNGRKTEQDNESIPFKCSNCGHIWNDGTPICPDCHDLALDPDTVSPGEVGLVEPEQDKEFIKRMVLFLNKKSYCKIAEEIWNKYGKKPESEGGE